jgi:CO/xanthine dehydrogenase Mo-binding subunit
LNIRTNTLTQVGQSIPDVDSRAKLTGSARYTSDIVIDEMLHAKVLRSPHPHALIRSVDVSRALAMPGVAAVVTGDDLTALDFTYGMFIRDQPVLAKDKVRYVGEPIAAVAASTEELAWRALAEIRVDYDVLAPVSSIAAALDERAPMLFGDELHASALPPPPPNSTWTQEPSPNILFDFNHGFGDVDGWFQRCHHVFEDRFTIGRQSHCALEPHVSLARFVADHAVEVWSNNQDPFLLRQDIARIFRLKLDDVRFHAGLVGGGFGSKSYCKIEPIAVLLARKARRAIRLALTMSESMMTVCDHGAEIWLRSGVSASGETLVREAVVNLDGGAYADASPSVAMRIGTRFNGPYRWRAVRSRVRVVRTTTIPAGSFRGFGAGHVTWACESQMDMIARRLGRDPYAIRADNFVRLGTAGAPGESVLDSDLMEGLQTVGERVGYKSKERVPKRGIGFAVAVKGGGGSHRADARVRVWASGAVSLAAGVTEIGQSTRTVLTQIAAEVLNIDPDRVAVEDIDTDTTPFDSGTHASNGATVAGLAVREAAEKARVRILEFAGGILQCTSAELDFCNFQVRRGENRYLLADLVAQRGPGVDTMFAGEASVQTGSGSFFWMPVWTAVEVEVDAETGAFKILRLINATDAGRAINPQRCVSQIEGAAVQGLGQALFENLAYCEAQPLNATPLKYRLPRISDVPHQFETIILEQGHGPGAYGVKGLGESGNLTIPAAIANAIADAVGARVTDLPITPDRVLKALGVASKPNTNVTRTVEAN